MSLLNMPAAAPLAGGGPVASGSRHRSRDETLVVAERLEPLKVPVVENRAELV